MFTKTYPPVNFSPQSGAMNLLCLRRGFWRNMIWGNIPGAGGRAASAYPWALIHNRECQSKSRQNWPLTEQLLKNQSSKIDTPRYPLTVLRPCGQEDNSVRLYDHYFHIGLGTEIPSSAAEPVPKFGMERNGIIRKTVSLLLCLIGALL